MTSNALRIDDPLAAAPMHGVCGALGVLFVGFMAKQSYVTEVYGERPDGYGQGVFYGGNGRQLGAQVTGALLGGLGLQHSSIPPLTAPFSQASSASRRGSACCWACSSSASTPPAYCASSLRRSSQAST